MPQITSITYQEKNKNRCNVFVDGEFFCGMSLETVMKNRLKVGQDVDKEWFKEVVKESEKSDALNKAAEYISKRLKTKREIKDYLLKKGYSEDIAWYCVDKLKEYGYVDDVGYSKRYIESTSKTQGKRLVEYKLMMKGVRKDDIGAAFDEMDVQSKENARVLAEKHIKNKEVNKENLAKTYRYLIGRGFSYEDASYAIDKIKGDN